MAKKIFSFGIFFLGGSLLLFILSISGCTIRKDLYAYKDVKMLIFNQDSAGQQLAPGDTCSFAAAYMQLSLERNNLTSASVASIGNQAYAMKLQEPQFKCVEEISDIKIITLQDYNARFPAGTDITPVCGFNNNSINPGAAPVSDFSLRKEEVIKAINEATTVYTEFPPAGCYFKIKEPPGLLSSQQFVLEIRTKQNTLLRDTSVAFILKP